MTIGEVLAAQTARLSATSESARTDASLLLAHVVQRERAWLLAHDDEPLKDGDLAVFTALCDRRALGEPVAYLLGSAWFYGRAFVVSDTVLVPRPETELLVDAALTFARSRSGICRIADIGTGSGALAITLAAELPNAYVDATDRSTSAIDIAHLNAGRLGVASRCRFHLGDLAEPLRGGRYDLLVANLPYVPTGRIARRPDPVSYEPRLALDGGSDGLDLYRRLSATLSAILAPGALVLAEAGPENVAPLAALLRARLATAACEIVADYAGLPRFVRLRAR